MKKIIIYATCQGIPFRDFLMQSEDISREYEIEYHSNFSAPGEASFSICKSSLSNCNIFIYRPTKKFDIESVRKNLPDDVVILQIPYVTFRSYWPDFSIVADKPLGKSREYPYGKIPYRSALLDDIASNNSSITDARDKYLGVDDEIVSNCRVSLIRDLEYLNKIDEISGPFFVREYIENNFRDRQLFYMFNHPKNEIYLLMANQFLKFIGYKTLDNSVEKKVNGHMVQNLPIHPVTSSYLDLKFCDEQAKYSYLGELFTFGSFVESYIEYVHNERVN